MSISKSLICLAALFAGSSAAIAQAPTPTSAHLMPIPAVVTASATAPQPAVWVVRDADSTIYLFGTVHVLKRGDEWGGPVAKAALAEADDVWLELEMDSATWEALSPIAYRLGTSGVDPLSRRMPPARARQLGAIARSLRVPADSFEMYKPWLAGLIISNMPLEKAGYNQDYGVERQIEAAAQARNKTMRAFETGRQQLNFFARLPDAVQMELLFSSMDEFNKGPALLDKLVGCWRVGDEACLEAEAVEDLKQDSPELHDVLLVNRNTAWVETLGDEMRGRGVDFVAVGAAHLVGDDSVVAMLRAKGYSVERLTAAPVS